MSFFEDEQVLTKHFLDGWDLSPYSEVPVDLVGQKTPATDAGVWVRFRVKRAPSAPFAIGPSRRNFGSVLVQILSRTGEGPAALLTIADYVSLMFKDVTGAPLRIGALRTKTSSASPIMEDDGVISLTVDIPYTSDHTS